MPLGLSNLGLGLSQRGGGGAFSPDPATLIASWSFTESSAPYTDSVNGFELVATTGGDPPKAADFATGMGALDFTPHDRLEIAAGDAGILNFGANGDDQMSVLAWFTRDTTGTSFIAGIWDERNAEAARQYGLFISLPLYGGDDRVCGHVSKTGTATTGYPYNRDYSWNARGVRNDTNWHLAAMTYDGRAIRSYLDGAFDPVTNYTDVEGNTSDPNPYAFTEGLNDALMEFTVGSCRLGSGVYGNSHNGKLAGLRIYRGVLTHEQIRDIYLAELPASQSVFYDGMIHINTGSTPEYIGWKSYSGATATDYTKTAVNPDFFFRPAISGVNIYISRTTGATGPGLAWYAGYEDAPLPFDDLTEFSAAMLNASTSDEIRFAIKVDGAWYASAATYSSSSNWLITDWASIETITVALNRTAANWRAITFTPGSALSLGAVLGSDISGDGLEGFGFFMDSTPTAEIRLRNFDLS